MFTTTSSLMPTDIMEEKSTSFNVRPFRNGDEVGMLDVHRKSIYGLCAADYTKTQLESWISPRKPQDYLQSIATNNEQFLVVESGNAIAGFSGWYLDQIRGFYIHPGFAKKGAGRALFLATENDFRLKSGFSVCTIVSTLTARGFYERMGFKFVRRSLYQFRDGTSVATCDLIKHYS